MCGPRQVGEARLLEGGLGSPKNRQAAKTAWKATPHVYETVAKEKTGKSSIASWKNTAPLVDTLDTFSPNESPASCLVPRASCRSLSAAWISAGAV